MSATKTIDIDFDVHQMIEAERRSFDESPNAALRRLLKLPDVADNAPLDEVIKSLPQGQSAWLGGGVALPHGTRLLMWYGRGIPITGTGEIVDGWWSVEGQVHGTPSSAASAVVSKARGKHTNINGWVYWQVRRPGDDEFVMLSHLRRLAFESRLDTAERLYATAVSPT